MAPRTVESAAAPAEYGYPDDIFDFPYMLGDNSRAVEAYDYADDGGAPRPYAYVSNAGFEALSSEAPDSQGRYGVAFTATPALVPQNNNVSITPAPGSEDLALPRDTPFFPVATNRVYHSDGPVGGNGTVLSGDVQELMREVPGVGGPVSGDGQGYSNMLAQSYQASLFNMYSQEAASSALVASV